MYDERKLRISYALLYAMVQISELNNKVRHYGTDMPLHEAEIHMIKVIKESEGISVTKLAGKLEVTKGAVSQILARLDKKGMIVKNTDPTNLSRLVIGLTPKGQIAYENHAHLHEEFESVVTRALDGSSESERAFLLSFMNKLSVEMENFDKNNIE